MSMYARSKFRVCWKPVPVVKKSKIAKFGENDDDLALLGYTYFRLDAPRETKPLNTNHTHIVYR